MDLKKLKYKEWWTQEEVTKFCDENFIEGMDVEIWRLIKDTLQVSLSMETENNKHGDLVIVMRGQRD